MSNARDWYDGPRDLDQDIGSAGAANILAQDADQNGLRRTPEQALNILYGTRAAASSGGFFPAGINGVIRFSGANET